MSDSCLGICTTGLIGLQPRAISSHNMISEAMKSICSENKMELLAREPSDPECSLEPPGDCLVDKPVSDVSLDLTDDQERGAPCDSVILNALSKRESRGKVIEIEHLVQEFVARSESREMTFSPNLTHSTFERLLVHRISQHYGLSTSVDASDCVIVATKVKDVQKAAVVLKDIEVEMQEDEEGWQHSGRRRRKNGSTFSNDGQRFRNTEGTVRGKQRYSQHRDDGRANAGHVNGHQMLMAPNGAGSSYTRQEPVNGSVRAQMRNQQRDSYDPDFHRHNSYMQNRLAASRPGVYPQHMAMVQQGYQQLIQPNQMTPVMMHPYPVAVSQVAYTPYGYVPMVAPEAMMYPQSIPYGRSNGFYVPNMQNAPGTLNVPRPASRSPPS